MERPYPHCIDNKLLYQAGDKVLAYGELAEVTEVGIQIRVRFAAGGGAWVRRCDLTLVLEPTTKE